MIAINYMDQEPSNKEILEAIIEAINIFANNVDGRFENMERRFEQIDKRFDGLELRITRVEATMVTKSYLDDKLADLKGDMIGIIKKEDDKVNALTHAAWSNKAIKDSEAKRILSMNPLAKV